jgi:hypothetical protein
VSYSVKALRGTASVALVLAVCVLLALGLVGCGGDSTTTTQKTVTTVVGVTTTSTSADAAALVGKWYNKKLKETLEFTSDGKMIWTGYNMKAQSWPFTVAEGAVVFTQPNDYRAKSIPFVVRGDTLTTQDPKYGELTYTRQ